MANRIEQNVIIVDSSMGNVFLLAGDSSKTLNLQTHYKVQCVAISNSGTILKLSGANTTNILVTVTGENMYLDFPTGLSLTEIKVPVCTGGTGFIYLA